MDAQRRCAVRLHDRRLETLRARRVVVPVRVQHGPARVRSAGPVPAAARLQLPVHGAELRRLELPCGRRTRTLAGHGLCRERAGRELLHRHVRRSLLEWRARARSPETLWHTIRAKVQVMTDASAAHRATIAGLRRTLLTLALAVVGIAQGAGESYDLVIANGRVIDPESGLDALRHVGIANGRIAAISEAPLEGRVRLDATGCVVAPGFIDLHSHV